MLWPLDPGNGTDCPVLGAKLVKQAKATSRENSSSVSPTKRRQSSLSPTKRRLRRPLHNDCSPAAAAAAGVSAGYRKGGALRFIHTVEVLPERGDEPPIPFGIDSVVVSERDYRRYGGDVRQLRRCQVKQKAHVPNVPVDGPPSPRTLYDELCRKPTKLRDPWKGLQNPEWSRQPCEGDRTINQVWGPTQKDTLYESDRCDVEFGQKKEEGRNEEQVVAMRSPVPMRRPRSLSAVPGTSLPLMLRDRCGPKGRPRRASATGDVSVCAGFAGRADYVKRCGPRGVDRSKPSNRMCC